MVILSVQCIHEQIRIALNYLDVQLWNEQMCTINKWCGDNQLPMAITLIKHTFENKVHNIKKVLYIPLSCA